ncbi:MAG: hypothetical protein Q8N00_00430 [Nitrospirota bacterium]|nr:hypothetical protein [Nitrospirota bacterium]MDP3598953.1 hypothetical protein [Nitrospirota bacterium]
MVHQRLMLVGLIGFVVLSGVVGSADAATVEWDRNSESDLQDYQVWACFAPNCIVVKSPATLQPGTVAQPAAGVKPSYVINITGREGAVAISARDRSLNESGLSVSVPFDLVAPSIPVNLIFR